MAEVDSWLLVMKIIFSSNLLTNMDFPAHVSPEIVEIISLRVNKGHFESTKKYPTTVRGYLENKLYERISGLFNDEIIIRRIY